MTGEVGMENKTNAELTAGSAWQATQVYAMAIICLAVGLATGYLFRGSQPPAAAMPPASNSQSGVQPSAPATGMAAQMPSLDQMKQMADKKAEPLLEKLKTSPNDSKLLIQVGNIYMATHQFKEAATYFDKSLQVDPKNVAIRTEMASSLYYTGDVDGAIRQLQQSLQYDPKDANSLFNLGLIKWQGKKDSKGALAAWQELLKANPQLDVDRKVKVKKRIAEVQMQGKN